MKQIQQQQMVRWLLPSVSECVSLITISFFNSLSTCWPLCLAACRSVALESGLCCQSYCSFLLLHSFGKPIKSTMLYTLLSTVLAEHTHTHTHSVTLVSAFTYTYKHTPTHIMLHIAITLSLVLEIWQGNIFVCCLSYSITEAWGPHTWGPAPAVPCAIIYSFNILGEGNTSRILSFIHNWWQSWNKRTPAVSHSVSSVLRD